MAQTTIGHVFMSYSRRDNDVMWRIARFLRGKEIKVWVDNEKLIPGTPIWEEEIEKAIRVASAIVVIMSPDSRNSEWVRREISLADQNRKRVFPVLVSGTEDTSITLRLITRQYVDLRENEEAGLNSLHISLSIYLDELQAQLDEKAREEAERKAKEEAEWLAAQKRIAAEKRRADKAEKERKVKAEVELLTAQKAEEEHAADEAEKKRLAKLEAERLATQKVEEERISKAKLEAERLAEEKRHADEERLAAQKVEEQERIAKAKLEAERLAEEKRRANEKAETVRLAQANLEAERIREQIAKAKARQLAAQKAEAERATKEKLEAKRHAKEKRLADEIAEADRIARQGAAKRKATRLKAEQEAAELAAQQAAEKAAIRKSKAKRLARESDLGRQPLRGEYILFSGKVVCKRYRHDRFVAPPKRSLFSKKPKNLGIPRYSELSRFGTTGQSSGKLLVTNVRLIFWDQVPQFILHPTQNSFEIKHLQSTHDLTIFRQRSLELSFDGKILIHSGILEGDYEISPLDDGDPAELIKNINRAYVKLKYDPPLINSIDRLFTKLK